MSRITEVYTYAQREAGPLALHGSEPVAMCTSSRAHLNSSPLAQSPSKLSGSVPEGHHCPLLLLHIFNRPCNKLQATQLPARAFQVLPTEIPIIDFVSSPIKKLPKVFLIQPNLFLPCYFQCEILLKARCFSNANICIIAQLL